MLSVVRQPDEEMDYDSGKDVADESLQDAKVPMRIKWFSDSYIDIPVWR